MSAAKKNIVKQMVYFSFVLCILAMTPLLLVQGGVKVRQVAEENCDTWFIGI